MKILGIDVGGSGIKAAIVDIEKGKLISERKRIPTPKKSTPENISKVIHKLIEEYNWDGIVGIGFPAVIKDNKVKTATNISKNWINTDINKLLSKQKKLKYFIVNDADAAGIAESVFGAGKNKKGIILLITIGTGLGTVLINNNQLIPNLELGQIEIKGKNAEEYASDRARKKHKMSWKKWGKRLNKYISTVEFLTNPDVIILGGGISKKYEKYKKYLNSSSIIVTANLKNEAGIVGAAYFAYLNSKKNIKQ